MKMPGTNTTAVLFVALLIISACSASSGGDASSGAGATAATGSGASGGGTLTVSVTSGSGGQCPDGCSADLKQVIDCHGATVTQCDIDQACLNGKCTGDPCGAAAAAKSAIGCDYWAVKPDVIIKEAADFACFAAFVANTWDTPVHIDASYGGQAFTDFIYIPEGQGSNISYKPYDAVAGLGVGEVAILFLSDDKQNQYFMPACPMPSGMTANPGIYGTGIGQAINIQTDRPISAYSIFPYGGGSAAVTSASMLLPTSVWDMNYLAINAYKKSLIAAGAVPSLAILAYQDNTKVSILPKVAIDGGPGVQQAAANTLATYTLNRGEYLQLSQQQELTGSPIEADKPIGVWGAASCLNVPADVGTCDSAHQQIPPVKALGHDYVAVRHRNRATANVAEETPPWRLVGAVDGTTLTWQPSTPAGAPTTLQSGEVAEFAAAGPFTVTSQSTEHPFYMAQYMVGCTLYQTLSEGDAEWVNIIPTGQYLKRYVFFTDPTYPETNLVVVRKRTPDKNEFADVTLNCAGVLTGWKPIGDYEYTRIDLVTGDFKNVGACSNGRQEMTSDAPFAVTVWGWGMNTTTPSTPAVSYAYPAGAGIAVINEVSLPPIPK